MDDGRVGAAFRAVRVRRGWRQVDVAAAAGFSASLVSDIERGHLASLSVDAIRRIAAVLEIRIDLNARWRGGELDRLVNSRHNALANLLAEWLTSLGWEVAPEVSFAIAGDRGVVDLLAWHAPSRTLLVVEVKTEIVDPQELIATIGRKTRLARQIARDRRWYPDAVATWVAVADSSMNRSRAEAHRALLRSALPGDTRLFTQWIANPSKATAVLTFVSPNSFRNFGPRGVTQPLAARKRVRVTKRAGAKRGSARDAADTPR